MTSSPEASGVIKDIAIIVGPAPSAPKHCNAVALGKGCLAASWCWADNGNYSTDMICVAHGGRKLISDCLDRSDLIGGHSNTFWASRNCGDKDQVKLQIVSAGK